MTLEKLYREARFEADASQAKLLGSILRVFTCHVKTSDQQCVHMLVVEWLGEAFLAMREFFEKEAIYDEQHRLGLSSLKQFGQLTAGIQQAQKYLIEEEPACGRCLECRAGFGGGEILKRDAYELLTYYEQYHNKPAGRSGSRGKPEDTGLIATSFGWIGED